MSIHNTNQACCSIPPVQGDGYKSLGSYKSMYGFDKVYTVGESKEVALICIFDIFGFYPQTEQGADLLSHSIQPRPHILMPDFFNSHPFPSSSYPPDTQEKKDALQAFFGGTAEPGKALGRLQGMVEGLRGEGYTQIGVYGFCWGGKVTMLAGADAALKGVAIVHPAMLSVEDAGKLEVPLGLFPSKDEPADEVEKIVKVLEGKPFASLCTEKTYPTMHHGWAAARADLSDEENKKEFADVYARLAEFFSKVFA